MALVRRRAPATPERRMLARAAAVLACRIAAGFLLALALLGFCIYRVVLTEQHNQARQQLDFELEYGNPAQTTPCLYLFVIADGRTQYAATAPKVFRSRPPWPPRATARRLCRPAGPRAARSTTC